MAQGDASQNDTPDPLVGQVLNGRFSITEVIGAGGMGRVYKAIQAPLDRIVALKVLNPAYGGGRDPNFQRRFFLEASLTSRLRHPNTITVIDYGRTDEGIFYIAMEYVEGQTLAQVLAAGALPWQRALNIAQQLCRSLREAHKLGLIHRDLKPANVMLLSEETDQDLVKVLDFGLVKSLEGGAEAEITQAGTMLGSPLYMAPEQARQISDVRSDLYSLGVVLYHMLMGRPPFQARESVDAIVKHISQKVPRFAEVRPDLAVPPEVEAVVLRCLQKDPAQRYQTMDELLEALRVAALAAGASGVFSDPRSSAVASPVRLAPRPELLEASQTRADRPSAGSAFASAVLVEDDLPKSPARRLLAMAGAFALSLVAGGAAVWWATRPEAPAPATPTAVAPAPVEAAARATPEAVPAAAVAKAPEQVRFTVRTEPPGARVYLGDRDLGTAPVDFRLPPGQDGLAEATLSLTLEGYQPVTLTARGEGPQVEVSERLKKKPLRKPKQQYKDDPYKDDPYQ